MQSLGAERRAFLQGGDKVPYIIGIAGSVAVGKSTTSRVLQAILARWDNHPKVQLITTDGFLLPNATLKARNLMERKGFPESFDVAGLRDCLNAVKAGKRGVKAPVYSHIVYDIVKGESVVIDQPDILIVEGLNVLQIPQGQQVASQKPFIYDFFDFSIYIDAEAEVIREWYIERFLHLRQTAFSQPDAYFARYATLSDDEARQTAYDIWTRINQRNLEDNILPTKWRADLILHKDESHHIDQIFLRKI